jgi:F/Y-rich N-terminus/PHD-like zinc-binding domain
LCPTCYKPSARVVESELKENDRKHLSDQAWQLILEGKLGAHENYSDDELHQKLVEEIDWETRNQWRDEYNAIIRDAIGIYCMAQTLGDPRFVIQQVLQRMHQLPNWLGHRALRFAVLVKRKEWDTKGFSHERADVVVITAKLAAAFIDIVCRTLGINKERDVSFSDRLADLVKAPGVNGDFSCPLDRIKRSRDMIAFDESGIVIRIDGEGKATSDELSPGRTKSTGQSSSSSYKIASPLCGWSAEVRSPSGLTEWKDPRECSLCHLCGDDDAGLPDDIPPKDLAGLGRLLPMSDGFWVHTSCALHSSEVWEAPEDGLIHAVEKARSRGAQLKCFGCGGSGATVGCNKSNCPYNYHLPCARACGAVFTSNQQVFCASHRSSATDILLKESIEHMKALLVAPDKQKTATDKDLSDSAEADLCLRVGSLALHSLGTIEANVDGFHSENYITPPGYVSSRIYWSALHPRKRTVYILKIERSTEGQAEFSIIPGDGPTTKITAPSASQVYATLMERVRKVNSRHFSQGNMFSKLPVVRRTRRKTYGLNGPQVSKHCLRSPYCV